jgi:glutamine amidotransferase
VQIVVLDYGSGNVRSAVRALELVGARLVADETSPITELRVTLTADRSLATGADGLVVPGVGAFAACMAGLNAVAAQQILAERLAAGRKVLGICVGMQVLFTDGVEHGVRTPGLGLLPGTVELLRAPVIPHMGWNTVTPPADSVLMAGVQADTRFYFVHSYAVRPPTPGTQYRGSYSPLSGFTFATTEHGEPFVSAVESPSLSATQFHPEKSGAAGQALLANWIRSISQGES